MSWRWDARCEKEPEWVQDLFYSEDPDDILLAQSVCDGCLVQIDCLEWAMGMKEKWGVWGMHSAADRRRLARFLKRSKDPESVVVESFVRIKDRIDLYVSEHGPRLAPSEETELDHAGEDLGSDLASVGSVSALVTRGAESDEVGYLVAASL
jgi:hypothetical protein